MKVKVLASGSSGNSTYLEINNTKILIDCGISKKKISNALAKINVKIEDIDYIFITHEHIDHISGLINVFKATTAVLYMTEGTFRYLSNNEKYNAVTCNLNRIKLLEKDIDSYLDIIFSDFIVVPLLAFHDANEPVGYMFVVGEKKIVYLTDTGYVHQEVMQKIKGAICYIFEVNHEPAILMASSRPYNLKKRILSDYGHLSNADSLYALANLVTSETKFVFYAHISHECNLREIIEMTQKKIFNKLGVDFSNINFVFTEMNDIEEVSL